MREREKVCNADITVFLDAPLENTDMRTAQRESLDVYEKKEVQIKVRERYLQAMGSLSGMNVVIVDTNRDKLSVSKDIWAKVEPLFKDN